MADKFIDLDRSFIPVSRDYSVSDEEHDYAALFGMAGGKKWPDILELRRVIILAEANAGKTEELRFAARKLRSESKSAFFIRLEHLVDDPDLDFAFQKNYGSKAEFDAWLNSEEEAWFFLDSVDEARLSGPDKFERALQRFSKHAEAGMARAHLYVTSRVSEWYAQHDLSLIETYFPCGKLDELGNEIARGEVALPQVFALAPLNTGQIQRFAEKRGTENVKGFLSEIDHSETDVFCRHPGDLIEVLDYWDHYKKIETRLELLRFQMDSKLKEPDPSRDRATPLSLEWARQGVELLAAAVTFQRTSRILVPERKTDPKLKSLAIDPRDVLVGWGRNEITALLQRSLFDPAVYGAVRFHHRLPREFLTAQWLKRLLDNGKSRQKIEALFFAERYGEQVSIPSTRPVLSWLVLMDEKLRSKTAEIAPEVFLQGGDPSSLPVPERAKLLRMFCENMSSNSWQWHSFDWSDVRRFAHQDLAGTISELLDKYSDNEETCRLLLRMIFQREIAACADAALKFVLDNSVGRRLKSYAILAVGSAGSREHKEQIRKWILSDTNIICDDLIGDVIDACCPEVLTVSEAVQLLGRIKDRPEFCHKSIDRELETFVTETCPVNQLLPLLTGFFELLKTRPLVDRYCMQYSAVYEWLLPYAAFAAERLIREQHVDAFDRKVMSVVLLASASRRNSYVFRKGELSEVVPAWKEFNYALFWHAVHVCRRKRRKNNIRVTSVSQTYLYRAYWKFDLCDFDIVLGDIQKRRSKDDRLMAVSLAFDIYRNGGRPRKARERLKKAVAGDAELERALSERMRPPAMSEEWRKDRLKHAAQQRRWEKQEEAKKTRVSEWLKANPDVLRDVSVAEDGLVYNGMMWARDAINEQTEVNEKSPYRWSAPEWEVLIDLFGKEVAEAYRDGCVGYWRKYVPEVKSEGATSDKTSGAVMVGLSGLDIESAENDEWPKNLSEEEARIAARYAVNELNGFPEWLPKLHGYFPEIVKSRLLAEIEWEFSCARDAAPPHYVLDDIKYHWKDLVPAIAEDLFEMLKAHNPHFSVVQNAVELISTVPLIDTPRVASFVMQKVVATNEGNERAFWLAVWFRANANEALQYLDEALLGRSDSSSVELLMGLILRLGGRRGEPINSIYADHICVGVLSRLVFLAYEYFPLVDDTEREPGVVYSRDSLRDQVAEARSGLFSRLCNFSGKATYTALRNMADKHPELDFRAICRKQAWVRAEGDAEIHAWNTSDVCEFAEEVECGPKTHRELFDLVVSRLGDLKLELENGDNSQAETWREEEDEKKHRNMIGGWLRENSRGRYSVAHEDELADGKKPDLRIHDQSIDAPVPVELKIADNKSGWTAEQLAERLSNQLCGQYLRDHRSSCGVFLVVYRGKKNYWYHPENRNRLNFSALMCFLGNEAEKILRTNPSIEAIEVLGIDLSERSNPVCIS